MVAGTDAAEVAAAAAATAPSLSAEACRWGAARGEEVEMAAAEEGGALEWAGTEEEGEALLVVPKSRGVNS